MTVPCNGCTLCCQGDTIRLLPEDDPAQYKTEPHWMDSTKLMLAHQRNMDCIYLDRAIGCTIHGNAPTICKEMDCRNIAQSYTWTQARKMVVIKVWRRGRELLGKQ